MAIARGRALSIDRSFVRSTAAVGVANIVGRVLGILFSVAVAKLYTPAQFGQARYLIAIATVAVIPTTGFVRTLSRFVAKHRGASQDVADRYFSNMLVLLGGSLALVLIAVLVAGVVLHQLNIGLYALLVGLPLFAIYFELLRGLERFITMALFYVVGNILQLAIVIAAAANHLYSVTLVLVAYGLACVPPLLYIELVSRSPIRFRASSLSRATLAELTVFSLPLLLANASFTAWTSVDLLLVEHFLGLAAAGNYALAKTVTQVFMFVPFATTTVVLPRFVHGRSNHGAAYLRAMILISVVTSAGLLAMVATFGGPTMHIIFHHKYPTATLSLIPLSIGMALFSVSLVLETWVVSIGKPLLHAASMTAAMIVTISADLILIRPYGQIGAGIAFSLGAATGLGTLAYGTFVSPVLFIRREPADGMTARSRAIMALGRWSWDGGRRCRMLVGVWGRTFWRVVGRWLIGAGYTLGALLVLVGLPDLGPTVALGLDLCVVLLVVTHRRELSAAVPPFNSTRPWAAWLASIALSMLFLALAIGSVVVRPPEAAHGPRLPQLPRLPAASGHVDVRAPADLLLNPAAVDFGSQRTTTQGSEQVVHVVNLATSPRVVTGVASGGVDGADFTVNGCIGVRLAPYDGCAIGIHFNPRAARPYHAALTLAVRALRDATAAPPP